ncbi:hypothetical protein NUU61_007701 [Penicillium alfredii]|uniref:2EXR domain-containing protein n=1 Tax=Penicillium alfredii TaxID=1506179 RepID=A0A9W9ERB7_9EURO|nr:uncharacterized protein NUU61_007701 [Penicillium alfredii]KAJ5086394.1 hypothetical protein NUU61_007701 [Penicillium alfredii]
MSEKRPDNTPASFHLFQSLPTELQDHIWDLAVRPLPGDRHLHTFIVVDHYFKKIEWEPDIHADFLRFASDPSLKGCNFGLAVPHDDATKGPNQSAYRLDSGLWTACQQSRKALERRFTKNEWWSELPSPASPPRLATSGDYAGQPGVSHTASYPDKNGEPNHITIRPDRDLFHLVDATVGWIDWFYHYAGDHVPLVDCRAQRPNDPPVSFLGMDIAIEFEAKWVGWLPSSLVDTLSVLHDDAGRTVWFIDRRLRRALRSGELDLKEGSRPTTATTGDTSDISELSSDPEGIQTFYSWGYVFTEVRQKDQHLWEVDDEETKMQTVFDIFPLLQEAHNGRLEIEGTNRLRVLACEPDPSAL